jgi:hypothetical protein
MSKIAIIDFLNQDIGVKVLFPETDYFVLRQEFDRSALYAKYNINPIYHNQHVNVFDYVNDKTYDIVFIVGALYDGIDFYKKTIPYSNTINKLKNTNPEIREYLNKTIQMVQKNDFKRVCFFDNYDFDYDPNCIFVERIPENIFFFKRNYNKLIPYKNNVFPFPYITFGPNCNIDLINNYYVEKREVIPRIFFSGALFQDNPFRNRVQIYNKITSKLNIYNPGRLHHTEYMRQLNESKYGLDILGIGDPNTRTYEIFGSKILRLAQRSPLKWTFDEDFCEETYFDNEDELFEKVVRLESDEALYQRCLSKQNEIVAKYMNVETLRKYITERIDH